MATPRNYTVQRLWALGQGSGRGLAADKEECIFTMGDGLFGSSPGGKMHSDAVSRQTVPTPYQL